MGGFLTYPDYVEIIRGPGLLFWGTTSLASEAGYGTKLGYCETGITFQPGLAYACLTGVEKGNEPIMCISLGNAPQLTALLLNYNATSIARLFPGQTTSTQVQFPGTILAGKDLFDTYTGRLLFVPDDTANNPILLFQAATPHIVNTAKLKLSHRNNTTFPSVFVGKRKTNDADGTFYMGPIGNGVLR